MSENDFQLPGSSLGEIEKILQAYAQKDAPTTNEDVAKLAGVSKTTVSRNNRFLISLNLIEGGQRKEPTPLGKKLGHALHHEQEEDARSFWQEAITGSSFLSEQLTSVRVQKGVAVEDLPNRILYNSGAAKNQYSEAGARAVAELLAKAGLFDEIEGKYHLAKGTSPTGGRTEEKAAEVVAPPAGAGSSIPPGGPAAAPASPPQATRPWQIAINLQLQLPDFDDTKKYESLFRALRKHLLESPEEE